MPEFTLPLSPRDKGWVELRARLACVARELHFVAVSNGAVNSSMLLVAARNFAGLAMSIPMSPAQTKFGAIVDAPTLLAAQVLGRAAQTAGSPPSSSGAWDGFAEESSAQSMCRMD
jgi:hypothetical protein